MKRARSTSWTWVAYIALNLAVCASAAQSANRPFGIDLQGRPLATLSPPGTLAVVLLFLATDCPISNRYQPDIAKLDREFAGQHVQLWIVYPNPSERAAAVKAHQRAFAQTVPALLDPKQSLVRLAGARMTPEAAVFRAGPTGLEEVYRGRIDDRYLSLGQQRPQATRHELAEAVNALLLGSPVRPASGGPVGCAIIPLH